MANTDTISLLVDLVPPHTLHLALRRGDAVLETLDQPIIHNADEILLTGVDKLLQRNTIDKSALTSIELGQGIDKNSSLCRIVTSFGSALAAASPDRSER